MRIKESVSSQIIYIPKWILFKCARTIRGRRWKSKCHACKTTQESYLLDWFIGAPTQNNHFCPEQFYNHPLRCSISRRNAFFALYAVEFTNKNERLQCDKQRTRENFEMTIFLMGFFCSNTTQRWNQGVERVYFTRSIWYFISFLEREAPGGVNREIYYTIGIITKYLKRSDC